MTENEMIERGLYADDDGRIFDAHGNEYRDEDGQVCFLTKDIDMTEIYVVEFCSSNIDFENNYQAKEFRSKTKAEAEVLSLAWQGLSTRIYIKEI